MLVDSYKYEDEIIVCLNVEEPEMMEIGAKMEEINPEAYMNGYNWDAFLTHYFRLHAPDLLEGLDPDPEAGTYVGHYEMTVENRKKAEKFVETVTKLLENENEIYRFLCEEGDRIDWD